MLRIELKPRWNAGWRMTVISTRSVSANSVVRSVIRTAQGRADCTKVHQQVEALFSRLVKQLSEKEGVTEALKVENQMQWVQRMNNIRSAAMEIVSSELIYC